MLTNKTIGDAYEQYVFLSIKDTYDNIWLWKDFPKDYFRNIADDEYLEYIKKSNCDIVAKKNNKYILIQCKNYEGTVCMDSFAGFLSLLHKFKLDGIVYYSGMYKKYVYGLEA